LTADWGMRAAALLDRLAALSEPGPGVTRLPFTPQHRAAVDLLAKEMQAAGMATELDDAGTLVGRLPGTGQGNGAGGTFYLGSHQDSVRGGGAFDGIMGVVLPLLAIATLREEGRHLPYGIELLAFADEEGVRFATALVGSRALAGAFDPAVLEMTDSDGTTLRRAMRDFGLEPDGIGALARPRDGALGFLECHIEQGPVLEQAGEALGVVTAICGIERHQVTLTGETGHAGTLPMGARRDALVGAAELVGAVHRLARDTADLRGTVGAFDVAPNVVNAVPREVRLSVELRSPRDGVRESVGVALREAAADIARRHGLTLDWTRSYAQPARPCSDDLSAVLRRAVTATGGQGLTLPSGATHDASAMAGFCPIAMLFVRCRDGVSHVPGEHVDPADMGRAVAAIAEFLIALPDA